MTEQEKELLLKVLCELLPYGVQYKDAHDYKKTLDIWSHEFYTALNTILYDGKPSLYLRPMSSMTEEERKMVCTMNALSEAELDNRIKYRKMYVNSYTIETFDLFNSNHLDYRGLIPMGLAIKATEENNPYKE